MNDRVDLMRRISAMLLGTSALAAMPAHAQLSEAPAGGEEIVVTARRQNESLQDVPASISVLTSDTLAKAGVYTTEQIIALTPGVTIVSNAAQVGDAQINIRGINGPRDAENSVALVVDGILKTNTASLNQFQGDLAQVEILKGPQGALYGRNAAAGAIVMTTRKPGDHLEGGARISYGENDSRLAQGSITGPLGANAGFVVYGEYRHTDGFYRNTGPIAAARGKTVDNYEGYNIGGRLMFEPTDRLSLDLKARYGRVDAASLAYDVVFALPTFAGVSAKFDEDVNDHQFTFNRNVPGDNNQRTKEASLRAKYDLDGVTLTGWVAYSDIDEDFVSDAAAGSLGRFAGRPSCQASTAALYAAGVTLPAPQFLAPTPAGSTFGPYTPTTCDGIQYTLRTQEDISAELRLASNGDGPLKWSVGGYYLHINRHFGTAINEDLGQGALYNLYNAPNTINPTSQLVDDRFKTDAYAGFGSLDYKPSPDITLSAALRYDREDRRVTPLVPDAIDPVTGGPLNPGQATGALTAKSKSFSQWQPKISINYRPVEALSLFADWGIGFKAGGFNNQGSKAIVDTYINQALGLSVGIEDLYNKERSSSFEAGFKARLLDGAMTIDGAVYRTDVDDMQFFEFITGTFGILRVVSNIDKVRLTGAELSASYRVAPGWTLFAAGNVTDSKIRENSVRPDTVGNKSPYTAAYTLNFGSQAVQPLSSTLDVTFRIDYRVTGPTWFHTVQAESVRSVFDLVFPGAGTANYGKTRRNTYGLLDMRLGLQSADGWSITAFGRNITNNNYVGEVLPAPEFGGAFVSPGDRRTLGVELAARF